ncbi:MAG: ketoacyl-ACP synthase III [Planctomycetota bacterium]|nr:ketoacyl-ACP synthase III [Planctomycetota bacterium]
MTKVLPVGIAGLGWYVPERVVDNHYFTRFVDTSDDWILQRTGIAERRFLADDQRPSDIFYEAGKRALENAEVRPEEVDLVILATISGDFLGCPATACIVQDRLGCSNASAFDIQAACTGFVYGLQIGKQFIASGTHKNVLVIGGEALSRICDLHDRNSVVIFADGGGAVLLQPHDQCRQGLIEDSMLGADGSGSHFIQRPEGGGVKPMNPQILAEGTHLLRMKGREVYRFAVERMTTLMSWAMEGQNPEELGWVFPHQMNRRILETASGKLNIPKEKVYINIQNFGNTSSGTIPICIGEAYEKDLLVKDTLLVFAAFGAGLTWGAARIRW